MGYDNSPSVFGTISTCILVLIGLSVVMYGVYVAYTRKILRPPFVARVHFQNPSHNFSNGLSSSVTKINEPVMCTNRRFNQIFLNEVSTDEVKATS